MTTDSTYTSLTVGEHYANVKKVEEILEDSNALVRKMRLELETARRALEVLADLQHPKVNAEVLVGYGKDPLKGTAADVCMEEVARINALLGDRA